MMYWNTNKILIYVLILTGLHSATGKENKNYEKALLKVVENVTGKNNFRFADEQFMAFYSSAYDAPEGVVLKPTSPYNDWRYWNGVLNIAMYALSDVLNNPEYKEFSQRNIAFAFDNYNYFEQHYDNEGKWNYPFGQKFILEELDDGGAMGASVIEVYRDNPQPRYKEYIDKVADHIMNKQDRLKDGTLIRTFPYKYTLWADDLYMGLSFLSRMGKITNDKSYLDYAALQVINYHNYLFDPNKKAMYHNWYSDLNRKGVALWGRANGWALVAQVDLLDNLPVDYPQRDTLISLLQKHILGIAQYQSATGLWHQLLDKTDSYLETSCSAMFTYSIARAVNKGYIDKRYSSIALKGWEGIMTKILEDGQVEGVCTGTVVSDNLADYYNRPAPLNDIHGIGTVILAGSEILRIFK